MGGDLASEKAQSSDSSNRSLDSAGGRDSFGGESNVTVIGSDAVADHALDTVKQVVDRAADQQLSNRSFDADVLKTFVTANANLTDSTLTRLGDLAETKITDGANLNQKTTMVALAIGGAVVFLSLMRKK